MCFSCIAATELELPLSNNTWKNAFQSYIQPQNSAKKVNGYCMHLKVLEEMKSTSNFFVSKVAGQIHASAYKFCNCGEVLMCW
jgi:hypothetical protein